LAAACFASCWWHFRCSRNTCHSCSRLTACACVCACACACLHTTLLLLAWFLGCTRLPMSSSWRGACRWLVPACSPRLHASLLAGLLLLPLPRGPEGLPAAPLQPQHRHRGAAHHEQQRPGVGAPASSGAACQLQVYYAADSCEAAPLEQGRWKVEVPWKLRGQEAHSVGAGLLYISGA
jgi:hypothetical protein